MKFMNALDKAISLSGGLVALATKLGVKKAVVWNWKQRGVPAEFCPEIELITEHQVKCEELNPKVNWAILRNTESVDATTQTAEEKAA